MEKLEKAKLTKKGIPNLAFEIGVGVSTLRNYLNGKRVGKKSRILIEKHLS